MKDAKLFIWKSIRLKGEEDSASNYSRKYISWYCKWYRYNKYYFCNISLSADCRVLLLSAYSPACSFLPFQTRQKKRGYSSCCIGHIDYCHNRRDINRHIIFCRTIVARLYSERAYWNKSFNWKDNSLCLLFCVVYRYCLFDLLQ